MKNITKFGERNIMKKNGFTLAEVLITMGIIGVVAALTAPALIQDVSNAKIGPTLSKVKSTLENANRAIMQDANTVDLEAAVNSGARVGKQDVADYNEYINRLTEHIAGSQNVSNDHNYYANGVANFDGTVPEGGINFSQTARLRMQNNIIISFTDPVGSGLDPNFSNLNSNFRGPLAVIYVDIDGDQSGQNSAGFDIFSFVIDHNGGLIPCGSTAFAAYENGTFNSNYHWAQNDPLFGCNADYVGAGDGCAGSIFDNNLKVIYK